MRVLVATDQWFPDTAGGSARVATETARRLARRGHDVTVLAPRNGAPREENEGSLHICRALNRSVLPQSVTDVVETRRHGRRLRASGFDVLLAHQSTTAVGLRSAFPTPPLALVYHASALRELRFLRSRLPVGFRRLSTYPLEPPLALVERSAIGRAGAVLVLSEFSRSLLASDHPNAAARAVAVRGGVDTTFFSPADGREQARERLGAARGSRLLVTARRLEPRMGLEELVRAVARMADPDVGLAIVGTGILERELRSLVSGLGLEQRVRLVGHASDAELRDWYRAADLFVVPTVAYEGFGMVTIEALACGTPVVGTPVGATPELLRPLDTRLVARNASPDALAEAISGALTFADGALRRRCREYASREFAWDVVIPAWEAALEQLVPSGRASGAVG